MQKTNYEKGNILIALIIIVVVIIALNKYGYTLQSVWATVKGFLGLP